MLNHPFNIFLELFVGKSMTFKQDLVLLGLSRDVLLPQFVETLLPDEGIFVQLHAGNMGRGSSRCYTVAFRVCRCVGNGSSVCL